MSYFMIWNYTVWQQRWTIYLSAYWKSTFCVAYHSSWICTEIFQSNLIVQILLNSCKEKRMGNMPFLSLFLIFFLLFHYGKQTNNKSQPKRTNFWHFFSHVTHSYSFAMCWGFFIWRKIYLIKSTGKFTFHFYSIAGIAVMVWNRHKLGNTC